MDHDGARMDDVYTALDVICTMYILKEAHKSYLMQEAWKMFPVVQEKRSSMSMKILPSQKSIILQAARLKGKSMTEFIVENSVVAAENAILDQTLFALDSDAFEAFEKALNDPIDTSAARALLKVKAPWDARR